MPSFYSHLNPLVWCVNDLFPLTVSEQREVCVQYDFLGDTLHRKNLNYCWPACYDLCLTSSVFCVTVVVKAIW